MGSERIPLRRSGFKVRPLEYDWDEIQNIVGRALDDRTRETIDAVTGAFAMFGAVHADENTILLSQLQPALDSWKIATDRLCRVLRLSVAPKEEQFRRIDVIRPFIENDDWKTFGRMLPLELLSLSVSVSTAAERVAREEIEKGAASRIKNDLWSAWVCLIEGYLCRAEVNVTVNKSTKTESPFVNVIRALQSQLPVGCQRFALSTDPYESVALGIIRARHALGTLSEKQLLLILAGWGSGILNGYQSPLETATEGEIAEFKKKAERVFADIERRVAEAATDPDPMVADAMAEDGETGSELGVDPPATRGTLQDKLP